MKAVQVSGGLWHGSLTAKKEDHSIIVNGYKSRLHIANRIPKSLSF